MIKEILLTFVGGQDPFSLKGGGRSPGPIVTLATERRFSQVILFHASDEASTHRARETASALVAAREGVLSRTVPPPSRRS